jgi:hypothetical protein
VNWRRRFLALVAGVVGVVGTAYGAVKVFVPHPDKLLAIGVAFRTENAAGIAIFISGLVLVVVAVQIYEILGPIDEGVRALRLARQEPAILKGEKAIYQEASRLVSKATQSVRAASFREKHHTDVPKYWPALAKRRKTSRIDFQLVYGFGDRSSLHAAVDAHAAYFRKRHIPDAFFEKKYVASSAGLDLLLIDSGELMMALPVRRSDPAMLRAILITDPDVVHDVASWFDHYFWPSAQESA